ncbi:hypothetical protein SLEP1_g31880 [Rubroshorea leprosula]|uniref:Uncharacterized protein n=1 Tax=Rubroshorea leprosula TaxID=152421 RepID=A0AAV5KBS3_9ROSI|nr:hypothetical protein SLEP1_g31880 [Rubroshorea leprosula]
MCLTTSVNGGILKVMVDQNLALWCRMDPKFSSSLPDGPAGSIG